ncbi:hypothetical protein GSI_12666 [Ganoderma sinense ZZ0214-1]|uniref:Fungal lipase-type domain-containing protein n=1 Tax=Ganoderma sinense ZZ0214-1 TaxID=1077348 RepID=A0A2G8RTF4_9APHY|nr:hypothetical protein GSI_12666 [Ganoderma sinense ZZ0214-1]
MALLRFGLHAITTLLAFGAALAAPGLLMKRQAVSSVSQSQIDSYTPITHYASAGYCQPSATLAWNCGANCQANPSFHPVASGGDGVVVQFWYDPNLKTVVVSIQGTQPSAILPLLTDSDIQLTSLALDPILFPGLDLSILAHQGFISAHAMSATDILSAVQTTFSQFSTSRVLLTGHSLGAAIALLHSVYIPLHIPSAQVTYVGYGLPRVGNQDFADYVDAHASVTPVTHINNQEDPIPILPGRFLGFHHPSGEIHIQDSLAWVACAGQDNANTECIVGDVSNPLAGNLTDHDGPYNGIEMGC